MCTALQAKQRYHYVSCLKAANRQRKNFQTKRSKLSGARIFKRLRSPGIDSKEWISQAYVAWRPGTITLFLPGS